MSKYVEKNLSRSEVIVKKADRNGLLLLGAWIKGILFCWLLLIPTIKAIITTLRFGAVELAITNKRIIGKVGFASSKSIDIPLNRIQNVGCLRPFFGKIFNYGTILISTAEGKFAINAIKNVEDFKSRILAQIDRFDEERVAEQASRMASAVMGAIKTPPQA